MIYSIVAYGTPVLRKEGEDLPEKEDVKKLVEDMFETMYAANGVGLAAPQIGKSIRMFVVDATPLLDEEDQEQEFKKVFINPEIEDESGDEWAYEEGCLSIPNVRGDVFRPENLRLRYFDENWNEHVEDFEGMKARVIQHEYDHIEGILFTDYLQPLKKRLISKKLVNISKGKVDVKYKMSFPK